MKKSPEKNIDNNIDNKFEQLKTLIRFLTEKHRLLQEILNLSRKQADFIQGDELEKLERLLESKQVRIDKIDRLDREFLLNFEQIKADYHLKELSELDVEKRYLRELQCATSLVAETLEKIAEIDQGNQEMINNSYRDLKGRLKKIKQGKRARQNYKNQPSASAGVFLDKKH